MGSNIHTAYMKMIIDIFCLLVIFTYPFRQFVPAEVSKLYCDSLGVNQVFCFVTARPMTVLSSFLMLLAFQGGESLAYLLSQPFSSKLDTYNIDALIAGTEQTLFAS